MQNQIPKNWQIIRAEELCLRVTDGTHDTPARLSFSNHPLITSKQLKDGVIEATDYFISNEDFYEVNKRSKVDQWDLIFGMIGTVGDMVIVREPEPQFAIKNVGLFKTGGNKEIAQWLYYYFKSPTGKAQLKSFLRGTSQGYIPLESLRSFPIIVPGKGEERKQIISILSAFDDKIEINNKLAKTLEEMAQALFKEWFVKFRFPGYEKAEFVDSELGKIPKGWEVKKIKDVAKINKGISYSSEEIKDNSVGLPMINLANFQRGGGFSPDGIKFYTGRYKTTDLVKPGDIVIAMTDLTSNREVIGHPARVPSYIHWDKMLISLDVCAVDTEKLYMEFLYYLMLRKEFSYLMASSAGGTNVAHLSKSVIENYNFVLPERNLIQEFQDFIRPIFSQINKVELENQKLSALRDLLLPKLMKGEIRI